MNKTLIDIHASQGSLAFYTYSHQRGLYTLRDLGIRQDQCRFLTSPEQLHGRRDMLVLIDSSYEKMYPERYDQVKCTCYHCGHTLMVVG